MRILALPAPVVSAHVVDVLLRLPAQQLLRLVGRGVAAGDVAGAARHDVVGDFAAAGRFKGTHGIECDSAKHRSPIIQTGASSIDRLNLKKYIVVTAWLAP